MIRTRATRLINMPGIGVDRMGDAADALADRAVLRLENLDTDLRPDPAALEVARLAIDKDDANSYLPFSGLSRLRAAAAAHVSRLSGVSYDWKESCVISAAGLNGTLTVLLGIPVPGDDGPLPTPTS